MQTSLTPLIPFDNYTLSDKAFFDNYFEELKTYLSPLYKYPQGNCHNLVHYGSLMLNSYGVAHQKIWIYAPCRYHINARQTIRLIDPNGISQNGKLSWGFHVAFLLEKNGEQVIFDYFLDDQKPMSLEAWTTSMKLKDYHLEIQTPEKYLFFSNPSEKETSGVFNGVYFEYEGFCKETHWIPKGLAINETAYFFYESEKEILHSNTDLGRELKLLVGSVNNFECVLRDITFNAKMTPDFQKKHQNIILRYRKVYHTNLDKWIEKIDSFL